MSDRLAEIEARLNAATSGPWAWEPHGDSGGWSVGLVFDEAGERRLSGRLEPGEGDVVACVVDGGVDGMDADAQLIAAAPTDLRYLLDEVKRLRSALGPSYHVADIREDGWSIQHPIRCRDSMLDCDLHRVATHDWQDGCPLCGLLDEHDRTCDGDPRCRTVEEIDSWTGKAADAARQRYEAIGGSLA